MKGFYWFASYPKAGNTWLRLFLESYVAGGEDVDLNQPRMLVNHCAASQYFDEFLDVESDDLLPEECLLYRPRQYELEAAKSKGPMYRKVHDAYIQTGEGEPLFPPQVTLGVLYLVRDPRDVAISYANHLGYSLDKTIDIMCNPDQLTKASISEFTTQLPQWIGTWSSHVSSWLGAPCRRLVIRYEDLLREGEGVFQEVVTFLQLPYDRQAIKKAMAATTFERLQKSEEKEGFRERSMHAKKFFNKGQAGRWKDLLTVQQIRRIEETHGEMMALLGYI